MEVVDNRLFSLNGDLNQVIAQKQYLQIECVGFELVQGSGFFPQIQSEEEFTRALGSFWLDKVDGWWNYKNHLIKYLICTADEFNNVLREQVERKRAIYNAKYGEGKC